MERYLQILGISLEAVFANKFRSILTALGIIFGVAAVIAMMAIGNGARVEILEQIKMVGVNNIVILPLKSANSSNGNSEEEEGKTLQKKYSPGLTLKDAENIYKSVPTVQNVSPEVVYSTLAIREGNKLYVELSGVTPTFFMLFNQTVKNGSIFSDLQMERGDPVCVIGPEVVAKLFPNLLLEDEV